MNKDQVTPSVFNFSPDELKEFKERYCNKDVTFEQLWEVSKNILTIENAGHPAIDQIISTVFNENSYSVALDIFHIMYWREELLQEKLKQLEEKNNELEKEKSNN